MCLFFLVEIISIGQFLSDSHCMSLANIAVFCSYKHFIMHNKIRLRDSSASKCVRTGLVTVEGLFLDQYKEIYIPKNLIVLECVIRHRIPHQPKHRS